MQKITTTLGKQTANQPTNYEFSKIAFQRNLLVSPSEIQQFKNVETGALGEQRFAEIIKQFGQQHWHYYQNIWLKDYATFECDFLLITRTGLYIFEIKNYFGRFEYKNGQCQSRNIDITYNPINQAINAVTHLRNLLSKYPFNIPVKGILVFIGEHNTVQIHDEINYIDIITSNEVYEYIQNIISEERKRRLSIELEPFIQFLENFEIVNPYAVKPYNSSDITHKHSGIYCANCGKSVLMSRSNYVRCTCGFHEYREHTVVRTICEYGVLTYGTPLILSNIKHFIGSPISIQYLNMILKKHFRTVPDQKIITFENYGRKINSIPLQPTFKSPNFMLQLPN